MTRSTSTHRTPDPARSSEQTIQHLIRLLDESRMLTHLRTSEHFARALSIWLAALYQVKLAPWLDACAGMEKALGPLQKALAILIVEGQQNYHDLLGAVYMRLSQGDKRLGQYFTPSSVAKMMAEINFSDLQLPAPGDRPIRIHEPTCGSGTLILSSAEVIEQHFPGSIVQGAIQFSGVDLDPVCVRMAQLNMCLHGIGRIKLDPDGTHGEPGANISASDQPMRALFQPAKIIQGDALASGASQGFLDEERFPWIPILLQRRPGTDVSAGEKAGKLGTALEQHTETGVSSTFAQSLTRTTLSESAGTIAHVTLFSEEMAPPPVALPIQPSPARGKRRGTPLPSAADFVQPELFPRFF